MSAKEPKVARDVAEQEFDKWVEAMGLTHKVDPSTLDDEDKKDLAKMRGVLIQAIMDGSLALNEESCFVFTPTRGKPEPITFKEPTGASLMAADAVKMSATAQRQFRILGDMTGKGAAVFAGMAVRDLAVCVSIATLFLAT